MKHTVLAIMLMMSMYAVSQKFEGLAPTPPMGWNSWNIFWTDINEEKIKGIADILVSSGMRDAGYTYLVLDDGWMADKRDSITGDLVADPKKFPHGMKAVGDYIHSKGLKFGIYNCAGTATCQGLPGTRGNEYQDARYYASIGVDYLKFDWCYSRGINAVEAYTTMSKAIKKAGRPMVFSLCEWGDNKAYEWGKPVGHLWRTTGDIYQVFDGIHDYGTWKADGVMTIADTNNKLRKYSGPDGWNDPDMLEVGNGMSVSEDRSHFSIWCVMAAPLMSGCDLRKATKETFEILTNKEALAIDQDPLGIQGYRLSQTDSLELWVKPLKDNNWAFCYLNRSSASKEVVVDFKTLGEVKDELSNYVFDATKSIYTIRDLWDKKEVGTTKKSLKYTIPVHDVKFFKLTKTLK